jgi:hypothetical protein
MDRPRREVDDCAARIGADGRGGYMPTAAKRFGVAEARPTPSPAPGTGGEEGAPRKATLTAAGRRRPELPQGREHSELRSWAPSSVRTGARMSFSPPDPCGAQTREPARGPSACGTAGVKRMGALPEPLTLPPPQRLGPSPYRRDPRPESHPSDVQVTRTKRLRSKGRPKAAL